MTSLDRLRDALNALEDALGVAGVALEDAAQASDPDDVRGLLKAFGISRRGVCQRLIWIKEQGELLRWHQGDAPSPLAHDPAHESHPAEAETQIWQALSGS